MVNYTTSGSGQPRRQHKSHALAPLHQRQKFLHVHLAAELRKKYRRRALQVRVGDKVKVLRGQFAKKEGAVERVSLRWEQVYVTGMEQVKRDGTKRLYPLHPSNLLITTLKLDDKYRKELLEKNREKNADKNIPSEKKVPVGIKP
ncbi:MAG: 50S ribosomal protein L24 [Nanoarchaeota archaeon]